MEKEHQMFAAEAAMEGLGAGPFRRLCRPGPEDKGPLEGGGAVGGGGTVEQYVEMP